MKKINVLWLFMIVGLLCEPLASVSVVKNLAEGVDWLSKTNFTEIKSGIYHIHGNDLFYIVSEYETRFQNEGALESHIKYIDIHCVIDGSEKIGYAPLTNQLVSKKYDNEHDYALYEGDSSLIKMEPGMYSIFFPNDLHMPGIDDKPHKVKKVVMKVRIFDSKI
jgi:YhcH/YjgK/YiaL family protein